MCIGGIVDGIGGDWPMPPADATFHRPSQPAYAVQIVQNADVGNPTAPSCRAYHVEHGCILGSRSAGMPLPRAQVYAIKRIGVICWQFLSVEHRASWVVIEEDSFADASCLIQCVLLFGCLCFCEQSHYNTRGWKNATRKPKPAFD